MHIQETRKVFKFLMSLNDSYELVRTSIILMEPLSTVNRAYAIVLKEEKQRQTRSGGQNTQEHTARVANEPSKARLVKQNFI